LKTGKVLSTRDEVAAVAAVSPAVAEEAIDLIEVTYEELPGIFDPLEAMKEGAAMVHEEFKSNVLKLPWKFVAGDVEARRRNRRLPPKILQHPMGDALLSRDERLHRRLRCE